MRKCALLVFVVLLGSAWMLAQYGAQSSGSQQEPGSATQNSQGGMYGQGSSGNAQSNMGTTGAGNTLEGCLTESNGHYILTDNAGNTFRLTGDSAQLSKHVGQQISVSGDRTSLHGENGMGTTGTNGGNEGANNGEGESSGTPPSVGNQPSNWFSVTGVTTISGSCNSISK